MNKNKNRAFLKWAGGKYELTESIRSHLPPATKLVEPFVGAGSVFLNTDYDKYLLNDINPDLINLYRILQTRHEDFIRDARELFIPDNNQEQRYYDLRQAFNQSNDPYTRSVIFLYLNRHGYNGLCRYNLSGIYNVPFGRYKKPYFPEKELRYFAEKSQKATFTCESYTRSFARARKNSVIYCDPPYAPISNAASFTAYSGNGFTLNDQANLAKVAAHTACNRGINVLISNHDTPLTRALYEASDITAIQVKRTISTKGDGRKKVGELFALFRSDAALKTFALG